MRFTLSRKNSLHLPIQPPPLFAHALDIHVCMISCNVRYPDAPSSWLVMCPPTEPITINSTIHFYLESGQASHIFASVEYVSSLNKHAVEFAVSYPVADTAGKKPRKAWAYLSVLGSWALLPPVLTSIHHHLYDFLPESLPGLAEDLTPDPITPWSTPCVHIRREKHGVRLQTPAASQKRDKEYFTAYFSLTGRLPSPPRSSPPPVQPLRVSLPARPQRAACSLRPQRAASPVARPMRVTYTMDEHILARPMPAARRTS